MTKIKPALPKPARKSGRRPEYPFAEMKVGEMFEKVVVGRISAAELAKKIRSAGASYKARSGAQVSFVIRHCDSRGNPLLNASGRQVVRVWCEEPLGRGKAPKGDFIDYGLPPG